MKPARGFTPIERTTVHIYCRRHWLVSWVNDPLRFFQSLQMIVPWGTILCFEGYHEALDPEEVSGWARETRQFRKFLRSFATKRRINLLPDSKGAWSEQIEFKKSFAESYQRFIREHFRGQRFAHLAAYSRKGEMLFWFHDAFTGGDLAIHSGLRASRLRGFCAQLGPQFQVTAATC